MEEKETLPIGMLLTDAVKRLLRMQSDLASITTNLLAVAEAINDNFEAAVQVEVERRLSSGSITSTQNTDKSEDIVC